MDVEPGGNADAAVDTWRVLHEEFVHLHGLPLKTLNDDERAALLHELGPKLAELDAVQAARRMEQAFNEATYRKSVHALGRPGQSALCLSGGGIRSAAFCLGVLQGLARRGLLSQFHYLSTVSGGGYIGSWLTAWAHRARDAGQELADVEERLGFRGELSAATAVPLHDLRRRQQFITPRSGLLSLDTWAALALVQRDLLLNWLVFIPLILAALLVPRIWEWALIGWGYFARDASLGGTHGGSGFGWAFTQAYAHLLPGSLEPPSMPPVSGFVDGAGAALVLLGIVQATWSRINPGPGRRRMDDGRYLRRVMIPVVSGAMLLVLFIAPIVVRGSTPDLFMLTEWMVCTSGVFVVARLGVAAIAGPRRLPGLDQPGPWGNLAIECTGLLFSGATAGAAIWGILRLRTWLDANATLGLRDLAAFGVPLLLLSYLVAQSIYAALTSHSSFSARDREWLARASGYYLLVALAWAVVFSLVLFGPDFISLTHAALLAGGTGALTLGVAASRFAQATAALSAARERFPVTRLTQAACLVFVSAGAVVLSHVTASVLHDAGLAGLEDGPRVTAAMQGAGSSLVAAAAASERSLQIAAEFLVVALAVSVLCAVLGSLASLFVNVNTFSLHALYQARLVRTFLGASNVKGVTRSAAARDTFTDFCEGDDIRLAEVAPPPGGRLFPVLGMALNLVRVADPAWQERKAAPFFATPFRVGSHEVGFRPPGDMTLGTAMAISGAAASPNWGYHSSPLVGFVMMLFNIRLGQWLPNPRSDTRPGTGSQSLRLMLQEATGRTTDRTRNIYVSDGGHFDNLGVYEMLRRRCRLILVVDASQDRKMTLEDLGSTLRKAAVDLGVTVDFGPLGMMPRADPLVPGLYAGVGRIQFPEGRSGRPGWRRACGAMIYIKPGAYTDLPADVRAYAASNAAFPHDSTMNQFFKESQFESYRTLGSHVIERVLGQTGGTPTMATMRRRASRYIRMMTPGPTARQH